MNALQRHTLAWLDAAGWSRVLEAGGSPQRDEARCCLAHWAAMDLPLVVTQQGPGRPGATGPLRLGLAAPLRWGRLRLAVLSTRIAVSRIGHFPAAEAAAPLLAPTLQGAWLALCADLQALGIAARVHGSHGWELLTGLHCRHAASDIDLLLPVASAADADAVAGRLAADRRTPRIDGELIFPDGGAVAWREWQALRSGRTSQVLVKRLQGVTLETMAATCEGTP